MRMSPQRYGLLILAVLVFGGVLDGSPERLYDQNADAQRDTAAAIADATNTHKNVVLVFGADW